MKLSEVDAKSFPNVLAYMKNRLPTIRSEFPKIYAEYMKTCTFGADLVQVNPELIAQQARTALVWGERPLIYTKENLFSSNDPTAQKKEEQALARTLPATMEIEVRRDLFELANRDLVSKEKNAKNKIERLVQYLILHEIIHWVRFLPFMQIGSKRRVKLFVNVDLPVDPVRGRNASNPNLKQQSKTRLTQYDLGYAVISPTASKMGGQSEAGDAFEFAAYGEDLSRFWLKQLKCGSCRK